MRWHQGSGRGRRRDWLVDSTHRVRSRRRAYVGLERLECRGLLTGNLWITSAQLVDANDDPVSSLVVGEEVFVEAQWMATGLSPSDQYDVRFTVDGVSLDSQTINGQAGQNLPYYWYLGGWFASPGMHNVQVTVDPEHTVAETSYADNVFTFNFTPVEPTTLPQRLSLPIGGVPFHDWSVTNYIDVDPLAGEASDYEGGSFVYDGHAGYDLTLPDFAHMDAGVPVYAAAAGTITQVEDGNFDRQTAFNSDPANFVVEDFGNGWTAEYYHLMSNSITVRAGDMVAAGQVLGLVGSSGSSTAPHLHFDLRHDGDLVETFYDPNAYWISPLAYQGDVAPTITDLGVSNSNVFADGEERPDPVSVFPVSSGWDVWYWQRMSYLKAGDQVLINWYRPDGTLATSFPYNPTTEVADGFYSWYLSPSVWELYPGTWQVATVINGSEIGRTSFEVTTGAGDPTIKMYQGNTYLLNGRTTPIDFGTVGQAQLGPELSFQIENIGSTTLSTSALNLPPGFSLIGSFPTSVTAGGSAGFTVQLDSTAVGSQFGQITFGTNDPDAATFGFNVGGVISGTAPTAAPQITLSGRALAVAPQQAVRPLDEQATVTDPSSNLGNGTLTVTMASGGTSGDRLSIVNEGSGTGQVGFDGTNVTYGGLTIGTASISTGPAELRVALNGDATTAAVQALARAVGYQDVSNSPTNPPRYVRFEIAAGSGLSSNLAIETIDIAASQPPPPPLRPPLPLPPSLPTPTPTPLPPLRPTPVPAPVSPAPTRSPIPVTPPPAPPPTKAPPGKKSVDHHPVNIHRKVKHPEHPHQKKKEEERRGFASYD